LTALTLLELGGNQLSGPIPPEIGNLTALTRFHLWNNQLSGTLPPQIGNLTALTILQLQGNQLNGTIPPEIGNLSALMVLDLGINELSGTIPPEIGNLTALEQLLLGGNQLSGPIPPEIGALTALTRLHLWNNQLNGPIPPQIGNLTALVELELGGNQLNGAIPSEVGNLTALMKLNLWGNQLRDPIPSQIGNLTTLVELDLGGNQLSGPIPSEIGNLTALTRLYLWGNQLSGPVPPQIGNLMALTTLSLDNNQLSGPIPPEMGNLTALRGLWLHSNQLSGSLPSELGELIELTVLDLGINELSGTIPPEIGNLTALTFLNLSSNQLSGSIPPEISNLAELTRLYLHTNQLSGELPAALTSLTQLDHFHFYATDLCIPPTDAVLEWLASIPDVSGTGLTCLVSSANSPVYANTTPISVSWITSDDASSIASTTLWAKFGSDGIWAGTGLTQTGNSGTFDYTPTNGDGAYYFATVAADNAGNVEATPTGDGDTSTIYDTVAPDSSATSPEYANAAIPVNWTASDATSGVDSTQLWVRFGTDGMWASSGVSQSGVAGSFSYTPLSGEGHYYFATVATDRAGNVEDAPTGDGDSDTLYDVTRPESQLHVPELENAKTVSLSWTASDNLSGVSTITLWVKFGTQGVWTETDLSKSVIDGTLMYTFTQGTFEYTFTQGEGDYYFATVATDQAGNREASPSGDGSGACAYRFYRVYLPATLRDYVRYFEGPWEVEPNNTWQQANGPLLSDEEYYGYPNDDRDYFSIYTRQAGEITVDLTGHTGGGVQLVLWYGAPRDDRSNAVARRYASPYTITYTGPAGWYYIYIYTESGYNEDTPYTLRVTYPQ